VHERGVPSWQRNAHSGPDDRALPRRQLDVGGREQVAAGVARMSALRQRQIASVAEREQQIRNPSFVIDGRSSTTVRASVQDTRGKPYPLNDLSADICVVSYPPGAAPSKQRPAVKMPS